MGSGKKSSPPILGKRAREGKSPNNSDRPGLEVQNELAKRPKIPKGGRRGAALLKAAGVTGAQQYKKTTEPTRSVEGNTRSPGAGISSRPAKPKKSNIAAPAANDPLLRQALPAKLQTLKDIFAAIQAVYDMLRRRNKQTTFANLKSAVEEASGRRFTETHLSQLHLLMPDCLSLQPVNLPVSVRSTRTVPHTLLTVLPEALLLQPAALRSVLHVRLARHLVDAYAAHLRANAREKQAAGDHVSAAELEKAAQQELPIKEFLQPFPEGVPDVGAVHNPLSSESGGGSSRGTSISSPQPVSSCARVSFSGSLGPEPSAAVPAVPTNKAQARLSFTSSMISAEAILNASKQTDEDFLNSLPAELRRRSLEGTISIESLRMLQGNEAVHRRLSSNEANQARELSAALGALPKTLAKVRLIFGSRGPTAMKLQEVVQKIKQGGAETSSEKEILAQLQRLAEHAPEFMQIKPFGRCGTPAVWINRGCNANSVAAKLKQVAGRRQSLVSQG